jgi:hypothetical protein
LRIYPLACRDWPLSAVVAAAAALSGQALAEDAGAATRLPAACQGLYGYWITDVPFSRNGRKSGEIAHVLVFIDRSGDYSESVFRGSPITPEDDEMIFDWYKYGGKLFWYRGHSFLVTGTGGGSINLIKNRIIKNCESGSINFEAEEHDSLEYSLQENERVNIAVKYIFFPRDPRDDSVIETMNLNFRKLFP